MMNGWDMSGWGWAWMTLMTILGIAVVAVIVYAILGGTSPREPQGPRETAASILDKRLARGEIDETEYRRLRQALTNHENP